MNVTPKPINEEQRIKTLHSLHILDTPAEERFDRITRLAQHVFGVPIALVTLIDENRQWIKSQQGMAIDELPRELTFCTHTIFDLDHNLLIVQDATQDPRFLDNPFVINDPYIRFYTGKALCAADGSRVGTLCVMDYQPRNLNLKEQALFNDLAAMAEDELNFGSMQYEEVQAHSSADEQILRRQALVFENISESVLITDLDGTIIDCNPATERVYGYTKAEITGKQSSIWQKQEKTDLQKKLIATTLKQNGHWSGETRYIHRSGVEGTAEVVILPLLDETGNPFARIEVSRDITQRKRVEQQLKTALSMQQATFESTSEGVLVVDMTGKIVTFNQVFREMWQIPENTSIVRADSRALEYVINMVKDPGQFIAKLQELYDKPEAISSDLIELKDGRVFERYTQPQRMDIVIIGRVWNFRDVTERKRAEMRIQEQNASLAKANQELAIAREQADESNKLKSQFLATMSHELRTPLNAIMGFAQLQLVGMVGEMTQEQLQYQERILVNSRHLLKLINEVLDLSKIEAGQMDVVQKPFNLRTCLGDVLAQNHILADNKGLVTELRIDDQLPTMIMGDRGRLEQIIINLFSNAVKFTETGSVTIEATKQNSNTLQITITDTGIGIPKHMQKVVFDEFRQVDNSPTRQYGGTGLGLAIVKRLAILMNGDIRLESEPGAGSSFILTLPLIEGLPA